MSQSVMTDPVGPDWPLGLIVVVTPGTPVALMSLVDPTNANSPFRAAGGTAPRMTTSFQQMSLQGLRAGASHGLRDNTGNVYLIRKIGTGSKDYDDYGGIVVCVKPGQTIFLASGAHNNNVYSPYRYWVDGDNASDGLLVTGFIA